MSSSINKVTLAKKLVKPVKLDVKNVQYALQSQKVKSYLEQKLPLLAMVEENQIIQETLKKPVSNIP